MHADVLNSEGTVIRFYHLSGRVSHARTSSTILTIIYPYSIPLPIICKVHFTLVGGTIISKEFFLNSQMLESSENHPIIGTVSVEKNSRQENESQTHA
jgi:hypothetical protein